MHYCDAKPAHMPTLVCTGCLDLYIIYSCFSYLLLVIIVKRARVCCFGYSLPVIMPCILNVSCFRYLLTHNVWAPHDGSEEREATLDWPLLRCVVLWDTDKYKAVASKVLELCIKTFPLTCTFFEPLTSKSFFMLLLFSFSFFDIEKCITITLMEYNLFIQMQN